MEQEIIDKVKDAIIKFWEAIKDVIKKIKNLIIKAFHNKQCKRALLRQYYSLHAEGRSNNWRKMHGLKTLRN